jgi:hypothetical protein
MVYELLLLSTSQYAEPDKSNLFHVVLFCESHFNSILPWMRTRSQWFLSFISFHKSLINFSYFPCLLCATPISSYLIRSPLWYVATSENDGTTVSPIMLLFLILCITTISYENLGNRRQRTAELWCSYLKISTQIITVLIVNFRLPIAQCCLYFILILPAYSPHNSLGIPFFSNSNWRRSILPLV